MPDKQQIIGLITAALEELNQLMQPEKRVVISPDIEFSGSHGALDSMALVNLVVILEDLVYSKYNVEISLAGEQLSTQKSNPFQNMQSLSEHLLKLIQNKIG